MKKHFYSTTSFFLALALGLCGCSKNERSTQPTSPSAESAPAKLFACDDLAHELLGSAPMNSTQLAEHIVGTITQVTPQQLDGIAECLENALQIECETQQACNFTEIAGHKNNHNSSQEGF